MPQRRDVGKGFLWRTHTKGVVLLTAKKRVDIVQSSEKLEQLKSFYRAIVGDERNTACRSLPMK